MPSRAILAGLLLCAASPLRAEAARFEQKVVAIMNAGGTADAIQARLTRVGSDPSLTVDQRLAVDALRTLVRSRGRPKGLSLAEAEAFAARNPASPASAMLLAEAALSNDDPRRSADILIASARKAGPLVQLVSPATVSKLTDELEALADKRRTADLAKALLYSGWSRGSASLRSYLGLAAIRDEMSAGRVEQARAVLPTVKSPASLHEILIDDRLAPLRNDVAAAAGPRLEHAWREFLVKARDEWLERGDALSATAYSEALKQANQYEGLSAAFLSRFMRGFNCPTDLVARSVGGTLAESLAKIGRWSRAEDVMRRSGGISPPVYAAMLLEKGDFGRASSLFDRSLRAADAPDTKSRARAVAWLQAARDCASFRAGSRASATSYDPKLLDVSARLFVLLCLDREAEAQTALLAALDDEEERADALRWVQPFADQPVQGKFREDMNARIRRLQRSPAVAASAERYGQILDWPLTAAVPTLAELPPAKLSAAWQCGNQAEWEMDVPEPETIRLPDSGR